MSQFNLPVYNFTWHKENHDFSDLSTEMRSWLIDSGSLTERIIEECKNSNFKVEVLQQEEIEPELAETKLLVMANHDKGLIREVLLYCGDTPIVFARTVIPLTTLTGKQEELKYLGDKPLGAFLFSQQNMYRAPLEISNYSNTYLANQKKKINSLEIDSQASLWARRSIFYLDNKPLLVYEAFLSDMSKSGREYLDAKI